MYFLTNCVILDESAFHVNMDHAWNWSRKGIPAVVTVSTTRARIATTLGTIFSSGLIKLSLRIPKPNKKRKSGQKFGYLSTGTITRHSFSFLKSILDKVDEYPQIKGHSLAMANACIHKSKNIAKYIMSE